MKRFEPEDLYRHRTLQALDGSASHGRAVVLVSRALQQADHYESMVWRIAAGDDPCPLTSPAFSAQSPRLSPDGSTLAFLSRRDGNSTKVHLLPLDGGEAAALTDEHIQSILGWSHDGHRLLATVQVDWCEDRNAPAADPPAEGPVVANFLPYKLDGSGYSTGHRSHLCALDADSGALTALVEGDFDVSGGSWSPDGRSLAYTRKRAGRERHRSDLWLADADGANARQVTHDLASVQGAAWSPDGRWIAFVGSEREGDSLLGLWLLEVAQGSLERLDRELEIATGNPLWHPDGDRLAVIAAYRGLQEIAIVGVRGGPTRRLHADLRHVLQLAQHRDRLLFGVASMRRPCEVHSARWDGGDEQRHSAFNRAWFARRSRPRVSKRGFEVPDGNGGTEIIEAWLLLPPEETSGPYPLLVDMHGGPHSYTLIDYAAHVHWYALCSRGWAVLSPHAVGSGSYGGEFARRLRGHWGELDLPQYLAVIRTLQDEGLADERLACTGKSYGGFLSAWSIGQCDVFKAAVVSAPVSNIESHAGSSDSGYYVSPYAMDGEINEVRERYHALSPVKYCIDVGAATLILQGEDDQRCPLGQAEELFANLIRCSKSPVQMVVYPGGSHSLSGSGKPSHRVDYHRRLTDWVQRWAGQRADV
ncbi:MULTISPECIES: S9 family peptidase [Novilysobacter]|uniref:S9 family peptidase n=1 Tax=Novilysobacter TaxID=3382699 RepID=UPI002FCA28E5